jgi:hypothetical protein
VRCKAPLLCTDGENKQVRYKPGPKHEFPSIKAAHSSHMCAACTSVNTDLQAWRLVCEQALCNVWVGLIHERKLGVANQRDAFQHSNGADDQRKVGRDPAIAQNSRGWVSQAETGECTAL